MVATSANALDLCPADARKTLPITEQLCCVDAADVVQFLEKQNTSYKQICHSGSDLAQIARLISFCTTLTGFR